MALFAYQKQTQRLLREARQDMVNIEDVTEYINRARREIAMRSQCIRRLTPISGSLISATVVDAGSGYSSSPTITIDTPDFPSGAGAYPNGDQATALAIVQGGTLAAVDIQYGGHGYFQPGYSITDATGTGASLTFSLSGINLLNQGQEVYQFSDADLSEFPGVESIYMIKSVSLLYSNFRYSLACYPFTTYQALIRTWSQQWQYVPAVCAQYGQGVGGSFYMYPIPSQAYQMEWDCFCLPQDLTDDLSVEAIPMPWTEAVPYFAAHLGYLELQNAQFANYYLDLFDKMCLRYSQYARPGRMTNPYGRF